MIKTVLSFQYQKEIFGFMFNTISLNKAAFFIRLLAKLFVEITHFYAEFSKTDPFNLEEIKN